MQTEVSPTSRAVNEDGSPPLSTTSCRTMSQICSWAVSEFLVALPARPSRSSGCIAGPQCAVCAQHHPPDHDSTRACDWGCLRNSLATVGVLLTTYVGVPQPSTAPCQPASGDL